MDHLGTRLRQSRFYQYLRSAYYWHLQERPKIRRMVRQAQCLQSLPHEPKSVDLVFYSAVAPGETALLLDLLDSIRHYTHARWVLVVQGDHVPWAERHRYTTAGIDFADNPETMGLGGLFYTLRLALLRAFLRYDAAYYIKLDTDSLLINPLTRATLDEIFALRPDVGLAGAFLRDWDGRRRDFAYWREKMRAARPHLRPVYDLAHRHGFDGQGVQGGAYILSHEAVARFLERGWLTTWDRPRILRPWRVAEDHTFTMMTYAADLGVQCIGGPGGIVASAYRRFPDLDPLQFKREGRIFVHPLKTTAREARIRALYRRLRRAEHHFTTPQIRESAS